MDSYGKFMELAMKPKETGAYLRQSVFYFKDMVQDLPAQLDKMNELCHLPGFRHDGKLIEETGKSSYDTLSNVRSFYEYFCLMLIRASPNKSAFISYLLTDFNASLYAVLRFTSMFSYGLLTKRTLTRGVLTYGFFFPLKVHQWNDVCSKSFIASSIV